MNQNLFDCINIKKENSNVPNGLAEDVSAECNLYNSIIKSLGGIDLQPPGIGRNRHIGFPLTPLPWELKALCPQRKSCVASSILQLHNDHIIIGDEAALSMIREKTSWGGSCYDN